MPRIFLPDSELKVGLISITGENARYLATVLRCKPGDPITVSDSGCRSYAAKITRVTRKEVEVEITGAGRKSNTESSIRITLLQGLLKGDKMDLVIQKATELGVTEIMPVITQRSQVRETRKLARWQKIAQEASRQSGRVRVPLIHDTVDIADLFDQGEVSGGILFWEQGGERLSSVIGHLSDSKVIKLFTGPEGGFSEEEAAAAKERGFAIATLGKRVLRAETAAIVALGIVQYQLGDLGD